MTHESPTGDGGGTSDETTEAMTDYTRLIQRTYYGTRILELAEDGVDVAEHSFLASRRYRVPFENILDATYEVTQRSRPMLYALVVLAGVAGFDVVMWLVGLDASLALGGYCAALGAVCGLQLWRSRETFVVHVGGEPSLTFCLRRPSPEAVEAFMDRLAENKREYLRARYLDVDPAETTADELQKLVWLREHGALAEDEFEALRRRVVSSGRGFLSMN